MLFLFDRRRPREVVGRVSLGGIVSGAFHAANLGYGLAPGAQGRGLMHEALRAVLAYAFGPLSLHRLQANYVPSNRRSGRVLRRLGFRREGLARDYLLIDGRWQDHVLTSLTNPRWRPPGGVAPGAAAVIAPRPRRGGRRGR